MHKHARLNPCVEFLESRTLLSGDGLSAVYFDNANFTGANGSRIDSRVSFDWGNSTAPVPGLSASSFSARWAGLVEAPVSGNYVFQTTADDGVRLWVDHQQIINRWADLAPLAGDATGDGETNIFDVQALQRNFGKTGGATLAEGDVNGDGNVDIFDVQLVQRNFGATLAPAVDAGSVWLDAGVKVPIILEYYSSGGKASLELAWQVPGSDSPVTIPQAQLYSERRVFPADSGVLNVRSFGAKGDGITDDTAAIQAALSAYPNGNRIIYLPSGTYLVSDRLNWPAGTGGNEHKRTILQGENQHNAVIKLKDSAPLYQSAAAPRAVVWTGTTPAQRFRNAIRDLTVNTGTGNAGATGVQFIANNQGGMFNVRIISGDGQGVYGLDMNYTDEIGPLLVQNLEVIGFSTGVRTNWQTASVTFEHIRLSGQSQYGWWNRAQMAFVRGMVSDNAVTAIYNEKDSNAHFVLVDSVLNGRTGASARPAILNEKGFYARNVRTSGYAQALIHNDKGRGNEPGVYGPYVSEFASHGGPVSLFPSQLHALNLPVKELPHVPWGDLSTWKSPGQYGGIANDTGDDTNAIQAAIDSGATTVYLPNGRWTVNGTVYLRGNVQRIIGTEARIAGNGTIRLADGMAANVIFERIQIENNLRLTHDSSRTWVLSSVSGGLYTNTASGTGDLFVNDMVAGVFVFRNQNVWARQLNQETDTQATTDEAKVLNDGGSLWILGIKTERSGTIVRTINGGRTEINGGFVYATGTAKVDPMFSSVDSSVSIAGVVQRTFSGVAYGTWMEETRGGVTKTLSSTDMQGHLYISHVPAGAAPLFIDSESATGVAIVGTWTDSTATANAFHGAGYKHDGNAAKGTKQISFTPNLPSPGEWEVFLIWPAGTTRAASVPVDIVHAGGTTTVTVDQRQSGSWGISLGTYTFASGDSGSVRVRTTGTSGFVAVDGVYLIPRSVGAIVASAALPISGVMEAAPAANSVLAPTEQEQAPMLPEKSSRAPRAIGRPLAGLRWMPTDVFQSRLRIHAPTGLAGASLSMRTPLLAEEAGPLFG